MKTILNLLWSFMLSFFIAVKLAGTSLAGWSWWWLLMPAVPDLSLVVMRLGL